MKYLVINGPVLLGGILMVFCGYLNTTWDNSVSALEVFNIAVASLGWYYILRSIYLDPRGA